jgi:hypothetical protein
MFDFNPFSISFWNGETSRTYKNVSKSSRKRIDRVLGYGVEQQLIEMSVIKAGAHSSLLFEVN